MDTKTPCVDVKEPEDMQEYLARMNKQLEEMAAQHLQTSAPRRESLARATVRYLERKASATDNATTSAAGGPLTSLSAGNSTCRRSSIGEDTPGRALSCSGAAASNCAELAQQQQPQQAAHVAPAAHHAKHRSDAGVYFAGAPHHWSSHGTAEQVQPSSIGTAEHGTAACLGTPPRVMVSSGLPDWDALEEQQQQQPPMQSRISLFHSPQLPGSRSLRRTPQTGINNSLHSQALAMGAAAATCVNSRDLFVQQTAQSQQQQQQEEEEQPRQTGDGGKAGSRIPSFNWHQPQLSTTPEKAAGGRAGAMRPPRGRSTSQNGSVQHAAPAICRSASTGGSIGRAAAAAAGPLSRVPYGSSVPGSRVVSRTHSSRGAASSGGAIEITSDMLQGSNGALTPEAGLALADYVITPRAAANNNANYATDTPTNESVEVVPEHALFAAVEDAIDAAAAAVNKPEVLSPRLSRRFTADGTAGGTGSTLGGTLSAAGSFRRQASSLKGRAVEACQFDFGKNASSSGGGGGAAAAGRDGSSTKISKLERIADQDQQQQQLLRDSMAPQHGDLQQQQQQQQQAHLQDEQQLAGSSFDADDYQQQLMRCSLNSYSEIVCQGSVDDSVLLSTGATGADTICAVARALGVTVDSSIVASAEAAGTLFDAGADAVNACASCEMDMIGATEVCLHESYSSTEQEQEDGEEQEAQLHQPQQSSTAAVALEAPTNSSSGHVLGCRPRSASEPGALPFTQQQQQQQQQNYINSPVLHSPWLAAHGAAAAAAAVAASSSAPTLTSGLTGSSKHAPLHSMRMQSSPNLLGCFPDQLADMPLAQLGKVLGESASSNRGRCQASSGSSFLGSLIDSQHSARSSDSSHGVHRSVLAQQQQHGSTSNGSRLGQKAQGIHSAAVANLVARRAVHSQPLPNAANGLTGNAAPTAASADDSLNHTAGRYAQIASAAAATASHASAPGMLEAAAVIPLDLNFKCNPNDSQAWEQDDVLLGSPAGSPAASSAQLQLQQASFAAAAGAASRLGAGWSSADPLSMSVIVSAQQEQQQQQQKQHEQPLDGYAEIVMECLSPSGISNSQQQQQQQQHGAAVLEPQAGLPAAQTITDQRQPDHSLHATVELDDSPVTHADAACDQELCVNNDSSYTLDHATVAGSSLLFGSSMSSSSFRDSCSPGPSTAMTAARVTTTSTAAAALVGTGIGAVCIADRNDPLKACSVSSKRSSSSSSVVESPRLQNQHSGQQVVQQQQQQQRAVIMCSAADSAVANTAAADAAAQELGGIAVQDSCVSVAAADGSRDIVVVGHSMPLEHESCDLAAAAAEVVATSDTVQQQHAKGQLAPNHGIHVGTQAAANAAAEQEVLQGQQQQRQQQQPRRQVHQQEAIPRATEQQQQQQQQVGGQLSPDPVPKQQQYQQEQVAETQQLQQLLQVSARKRVTSAEATGSVRNAGNSPVKASSWGGRMLDRIASALKGTSSKQRPGSESGGSSQVSSPAAAQHRRLSSGADVAVVGCMPCSEAHHQHQPQQDWQQQQQQQSGPLAVGAGCEAAAQAQLPQLGAHLQQQQQQHAQATQANVHHLSHQQPALRQTCAAAAPESVQLAVQDHPAGSTQQAVRPWEEPTQRPAVLLLRATAVAVSGVGIAAAQGTPEPHLVSCGSTLHAPSLAVVALLLAASSFDTAEGAAAADVATQESAEGACRGHVLAVAAASVAICAAAQVAAWELEGIDMSALQMQADASGSSIADEPVTITAAAGDEAYQAQQQQQQQLGRVEQAAGAAAAAAMRIAARPGLPAAAAADELGDSFAIELSGVSSCSSVDLTGLPELLADVSKAQYSRPTSATYNAEKYTEPVSPMQLHGSSTGSRCSSRVGQHDDEQQAQQQHNQQQQQQQQCGESHHGDVSQQQQQQQLMQVPADAAAAVACAAQSNTTAVSCVANETQKLDSSAVVAASGVRASQAVQTLKQLRSTRRSSIGGPQLGSTTAGAAAAAVAESGSGQVYQYQNYQQPQQGQWQQQQQQLPPMCLGHGLSGQSIEVNQQQQHQQQTWHQQQQQQPDSGASQELSVTDYYQQLLRKQRELEQQRLQQQQQQQQDCSTEAAPSAAAAAGSNIAGCNTSAAAPAVVQGSTAYHNTRSDGASCGHKQLAALAKLKRGTLMRARQLPVSASQGAHQPSSNHLAVTASSQDGVQGDISYAANPIWGSAGGAGSSGGVTAVAATGADWTDSAVETAPQSRRVWASASRADEATPCPSQQQQQQFGQLRHRRQQQQQGTACNSSRLQGNSGQDYNFSESVAVAGAGDRDSVSSSGRDSGGDGCDSTAAAAAKPFLKRKSRAVVGRKLDWSSVQSKTITRLDDRYVPVTKERKATSGPSYDPRVAAAQARAGLMAPGSGAAAAGGSRSGRSRAATGSSSSYAGYEPGYEMEIRSSTSYRPRGNRGVGNAASGGANGGGYAAAAPSRAGMSSAPAGSGGGYSALHGRSSSGDDAGGCGYSNRHGTAAAAGGAGEGGGYGSRAGVPNRGAGAAAEAPAGVNFSSSKFAAAGLASSGSGLGRGTSSGAGAFSGPAAAAAGNGPEPQAPLDDLLNHVNSLIKEFDRMYK